MGAGLFGITSALLLSRDGWNVRLVEQRPSIMSGASGNNIFRLHRGYHYPRSIETAVASQESEIQFVGEYGDAVIYSSEHLYAISKSDSLTSAEDFLAHCRTISLPFTKVENPIFRRGSVDLVVRAEEARIDPRALITICKQKLRESEVDVRCGTGVTPELATQFDFLVLANNSGINDTASALDLPVPVRQYELCEVAVVDRVPVGDRDIVVMDGGFISLSPFGRAPGKYLLYDVVNSVQSTQVSAICQLHPEHAYRDQWEESIPSSFDAMKANACQFLEGFENVRRCRSLWSIRTVLPNVDATDERPTTVEWLAPTVLSVFSGKLGTSVVAGRKVVEELQNS
ncbi:FAD-dependent oxidoreductase [Antrihabitans spumae]|uniref:FAD-dependent oxidoreductase n=1 Tax=Antrihabitans spumae TaxID=3373370 RepID=A0ABW7KDG3_9NOCA